MRNPSKPHADKFRSDTITPHVKCQIHLPIRQLQQEIKKLKKTLGQKGKELEQKNEELDLERGLWKTRRDINIPVDAGRAALLHRLETLDGIINDGALLHAATLHSKEEFEYI